MSIANFVKQYRERTKQAAAQRLSIAAQRGVALAKEAMSDPDFVPLAMSMSKTAQGAWSEMGRNALIGAGTLALTAGVLGAANIGVRAVRDAYRSIVEGREKAKGLSNMLEVHPQLKNEDRLKVVRAFNTLHKFNPDMAKDPLVAGSFVQRAVDYGGITQDELNKMISSRKLLAEAQEKEDISPFFNPAPFKLEG